MRTAGVHPKYGTFEEALLIAAETRKEKIEFLKIRTICAVIVNPESAYNEVTNLQREMFPEVEEIQKAKDAERDRVFHEEKGFVWHLTRDPQGFVSGRRIRSDEITEKTIENMSRSK